VGTEDRAPDSRHQVRSTGYRILNAGSAVRPGFTILELLVVVGIIVVIASVTAPSIMSRIRENAVAQAAESVRDNLARSRTYAVDAGIDYQFRYEPGGRNFIVLPMELEPSDSNSTTGDLSTGNYIRLSGELDAEFQLTAIGDGQQTIESLEAAWFGQLENALQLSQMSWSSPIVFRFDGTADDGQFRLTTDSKLTADVTVRGLTGGVSVSSVYREAE